MARAYLGNQPRQSTKAVARAPWHVPEIDGNVLLPGGSALKPGEMVRVRMAAAEEHDLVGELL